MAFPANDPASSSSYIDYKTFTSNTFSPTTYTNNLVLQTNNPTDSPLDLSTPLARVLFDAQEVDTHIDNLTTQHALPIIERTQARRDASVALLTTVEEQVRGLTDCYVRLEREVIERHAAAEQVRMVAERMMRALRLGRATVSALQLGRQLEGQLEEIGSGAGSGHKGMMPAARTVLSLRQLFRPGTGEEEDLSRVRATVTLRQEVMAPAERALLSRAQQTVREFSMSGLLAAGGGVETGPQQQSTTLTGSTAQTFAQTEETKGRATSALQALYLLSPIKATKTTTKTFEPTLLIAALQTYLQTALTSSLAALTRALATLPTLDRTLLEISARCQNIVALEALLESISPPAHPLLESTAASSEHHVDEAPTARTNLLSPLLRHLDTSSLPSYFWRSLAGQLTSRVQDILSRGGVSARTLRTNRDRVRDAIRECVDRGSQIPVSGLGPVRRDGKPVVGNWEREAAVMVQSVVGLLQR